jgi:hypothetical protein
MPDDEIDVAEESRDDDDDEQEQLEGNPLIQGAVYIGEKLLAGAISHVGGKVMGWISEKLLGRTPDPDIVQMQQQLAQLSQSVGALQTQLRQVQTELMAEALYGHWLTLMTQIAPAMSRFKTYTHRLAGLRTPEDAQALLRQLRSLDLEADLQLIHDLGVDDLGFLGLISSFTRVLNSQRERTTIALPDLLAFFASLVQVQELGLNLMVELMHAERAGDALPHIEEHLDRVRRQAVYTLAGARAIVQATSEVWEVRQNGNTVSFRKPPRMTEAIDAIAPAIGAGVLIAVQTLVPHQAQELPDDAIQLRKFQSGPRIAVRPHMVPSNEGRLYLHIFDNLEAGVYQIAEAEPPQPTFEGHPLLGPMYLQYLMAVHRGKAAIMPIRAYR